MTRILEDNIRILSDPRYWMIRFRLLAPRLIIGFSIVILLFSVGLIEKILINYDPSLSLQNFYVPALNKFVNYSTTVSSGDSLIFFDLQLQNAMDYKGVRYDAINLTFSYGTNTSMASIGTYTLGGFYQGMGKKAQRRDVAAVTGSVPWEAAARRALSSGSTADFSVDLVTKVKFNNYFWYSKKWRIVVGCRVKVDDSGRKVERKPLKLIKSGAPPGDAVGLLVATSLLVSFFLLK